MAHTVFRPIVYVRGYAMTQNEVEETVDDPFYGFNHGATHYRINQDGNATFFAFESPILRLVTDYGYSDAFRGSIQTAEGAQDPLRTIWIYRYYDETSRTFEDGRPRGKRLTIEEAAHGLHEFILHVQRETACDRVYLVAHSMGGLVCRCLMEKILPRKSGQLIDKFVTFGAPHGGIEFAVGHGVLEKARDWLGISDSDNFGRRRMYEFLAAGSSGGKSPPRQFDPRRPRGNTFPPERTLCIVGTNARDYEVAYGLSRWSVGPQSDGLVQIENAYLYGAHQAFIHRCHSGRFGMVNSEEGYQNMRRFLFGDVQAKATLRDFRLNFDPLTYGGRDKAYHFEIEIGIQSLPMLLHQRTLNHFCPVTLNRLRYRSERELDLFTNFLLDGKSPGHREVFSIYLAVHEHEYKDGHPVMAGHIARLPSWSDYLIVEIERQPPEADLVYTARYSWASRSRSPNEPLTLQLLDGGSRADADIPLPPRAAVALGPKAKVHLETRDWA